MICPSCGVENVEATTTCASCGRALSPRPIGPGSLIGSRYEVLAPLGAGGMGLVYKARDRALEETVALKVLRASASRDPALAQRFRSEIKLAWKVRHRNVCGIHEYGEDGELLYISMELVEGKDLRQLLRQGGPLHWEDAYDVALQTADGLQAIHEAGVIHRDLKPANITRDARGLVRLMDFGIAKVWDEESGPGVTGTGKVVGSPEYMSPEQVRGRKVDFRSDLYALGLVIYEVFTGRAPFQADTPVAAMLRRIEEDVSLEGSAAALIPTALLPVLRKALARVPDDRYATCSEMIEALRAARAALPLQTTDEMPAPPPGAAEHGAADSGEPEAPPAFPRSAQARLLVPHLVKALAHRDTEVRVGAARALGHTGPDAQAAIPGLIRALEDEATEVRDEASRALELLGFAAPPPPSQPASPPEPPQPKPGASGGAPAAVSAPGLRPAAPALLRGSRLDRLLRLFSDVRAGEGVSALLLTCNVFLLLTASYAMKPVREALILAGGGAELKSYLAGGHALLLLVAVPLYARVASRVPRRRLIEVVSLFFIACLAVFALLVRAEVAVGVAFFLWIGVFNMMVVAQFWSFANDVYSEEEGRRLFPIVAFGQSLGSVLGAVVGGRVIGSLGLWHTLLVAAVLLALALLFTRAVDERERRRSEPHLPSSLSSAELPASSGEFRLVGGRDTLQATSPPPPISQAGAFALVFRSRYLLLIALMVMCANWVNSTGEYVLSRTVAGAAAGSVAAGTAGGLSERQLIGGFYSDFYALTNVAGLLVQLFVVSRVIQYLGVRGTVLVLPVIALGAYGVLCFFPLLAAVRWAKTAENATDYSLQNTVRQVLFLPTSREAKYKAKQAIDSFFVRTGDVLAALGVYLGAAWLGLGPRGFAAFNLGLVAVWIALALAIGRAYRRASTVGAA